MKIVYIVGNTNLYGSELHLYDLIKKIHIKNQIKLIAFSDGPLIELIKKNFDDVEIFIIRVNWLNGIFKLPKIKREIKKFSPDIVHSHQPLAIFWGSISSKISKKKHIATIHSLPYGNALEYNGVKRKIVYIFQCLIQFIAEFLSTRSIFITYYNKNKFSFIRSKAVVIYNWVSDRFTDIKKINRKHEDVVKFLSACSINKGKGLMELLSVFNDLKSKLNYKLTIVGDGNKNLINDMKQFIIANDLQSNILMVGYSADLSLYYNDADFFVLLTQGEAFGLVFVEAMKFGLPIVCTNLPQLKEIIPEENIFIDVNIGLDDKDVKLFLDNQYVENTRLINIQKANSAFNINNQVSKVVKLYQEVITTK